MILEMHCHTAEHSSCSHVSAADLVQRNFDRGLPGTVLTDHHYYWPHEELRELRRRTRVPDYYRILSGQEVFTPEFGDVLVYGADASIKRGTSAIAIREQFPDAAIVWAHPYREKKKPARDDLLAAYLDGVEIFNSNHTVSENNRGLRDWHRYKFTAIAGTDTHALSYAGLYATIFDHPVSNEIELGREIRAGRCRPYFKEIPRSGTSDVQVMEIAIGTKAGRERYVAKQHENIEAWHAAVRTTHIMEEIMNRGFESGRFRVPRPLGIDQESLTHFEQGIHGETIYNKLIKIPIQEAPKYLAMAAEWLARLHNLRLQITPPDEFFHDEPVRLERYLSAFYRMNHPHTRMAQEIMDTVLETETALYCGNPGKLVQCHGDFHPKNIFIGYDDPDDLSSEFMAVIDFDSSFSMPPAFDVGTFLAQCRNMFRDEHEPLFRLAEEVFLQAYLRESLLVDDDFLPQVKLFKARTTLSICYFLIKVGMGESENLWRVLVEAGQELAHISVKVADWLAHAKSPKTHSR